MKASRAALIAVLLPLITAPWFFTPAANWAWWGTPVWAVYAVGATATLAVLIGFWMGRWWDDLAEQAEAGGTAQSAEAAEVESERP